MGWGDRREAYSPSLGREEGLQHYLFAIFSSLYWESSSSRSLPLIHSPYTQLRSWGVLKLHIFSKFPTPASEFALRCSLDNCSHVHLQALGLALVVLLTFVLCWDTLLPARTVVLVLPQHANWSPSQPQPHPFPFWPLQCSSGSSPLWSLLPLAAEGTKNTVETPPGKKALRECPNRRFKPLDSWKYKQMWQQGQKKQKRHSCNIHLPRTEHTETEQLFFNITRTPHFCPCSLSFQEKEIPSSVLYSDPSWNLKTISNVKNHTESSP